MKRGAIFWVIAAASLLLTQKSMAQPFTQVIVFGDSNVDAGYYKALANPGGGTNFNNDWAAAVAHGARATARTMPPAAQRTSRRTTHRPADSPKPFQRSRRFQTI